MKFSFSNLQSAIFICLFALGISNSNANKPNVLILFTDDQGTLDVNCYGATDLHTPNMDKLAETGVRFTQAYAHTVCCPSRAALLTGRHPNRGGVQNWLQGDRNGTDIQNSNMFASEITIAEVMKEAGYKTALFGKWHLGAKVGHGPLDQGFDHHFGHLSGFIENYRHHFMHGKGYHDLYNDNEEIWRRGEYFPDMMIDEAVKYIGKNKDDPFFMMVAFNLPHYPEQPTGEFKEAFPELEMPRQSYARVVATVDAQIGRILKQLDDSGIRDDTIIIFSSDNGHSEENNKGVIVENHTSGYPLGYYYSANGGGGFTGKWIGHKGNYFEGGIRVPAIINYPKALPSGAVRDQAVTIMDWMPTLIDLIGLPQPKAKLDGRSMMSIINNPTAPTSHPVLYFDWQDKWAVREGDWKLISEMNRSTNTPKITLHNLSDEKPEVKDYAKEKPKLLAHLTKLHEDWATEVMP
ncbi:MAG: sulfatase-like hydrolase/transferase [Verrucomicrobia bacterium]|nr:sulfatase-like hydrolase/transferase [Verrucomicrobiota bacterium]MDA1069058.1 sulfatase-like hydrolase/transferase [Verrucomicrobiota bacterium]